MIPKLLNHGDLDEKNDVKPMMTLINTLYFEAEWDKIYEDFQVYDDKFTNFKGEENDIELMSSMEQYYYDLGDADAFRKYYKNKNYSFSCTLLWWKLGSFSYSIIYFKFQFLVNLICPIRRTSTPIHRQESLCSPCLPSSHS